MTAEPLNQLLENLAAGDTAAAGELFRCYEPYLRMVVRRQLSPRLRAKFDSLDVVQSVWVHLLRGFREAGHRFADAGHLHAFLVRLTRHRFIDRIRRHRCALEREQPLPDRDEGFPARDPEPHEFAQASELWEQILNQCPPAHRDILRLKRDGAVTADIAARTGLHEGSVRRVLRAVSRRLDRNTRHGLPDDAQPGGVTE